MAFKLTNLEIKNAAPKAKPYTMAVGQGLCIRVFPNGSKYWVLRYRLAGQPKTINVASPFPQTGLKEAIAAAALARASITRGIDPQDERRRKKQDEREQRANTFGVAAEAWYAFKVLSWSPKTAEQVREYLDKDLLPKLRTRPLEGISAPDLGEVIARIEKRKAFDVAHKSRQWLKAIFSFARAKGWTERDPARDLLAVALPGPDKQKFAHIRPGELPEFLAALAGYRGSVLVKACAELALWTANRPGVTRTLRWAELDLDNANWSIAKGREEMKRGYSHITPLPRQAVARLREIHKITGKFEYVFAGRNDPKAPLSDGALQGLFRQIGYKGRQTAHGFRHLISTALNEIAGDNGYSPEWIERQLAHGDPDKIRGTYNEATYLEPRRKMMQAWADHLEALANRPVLQKAA